LQVDGKKTRTFREFASETDGAYVYKPSKPEVTFEISVQCTSAGLSVNRVCGDLQIIHDQACKDG
jgi:hypothetical protein